MGAIKKKLRKCNIYARYIAVFKGQVDVYWFLFISVTTHLWQQKRNNFYTTPHWEEDLKRSSTSGCHWPATNQTTALSFAPPVAQYYRDCVSCCRAGALTSSLHNRSSTSHKERHASLLPTWSQLHDPLLPTAVSFPTWGSFSYVTRGGQK